jgi:uncharacterized protein (TIGR02099 family)
MLRLLSYLVRKALLLLAVAVIALAVLVQAGRSLMPLAADYREPLAELLSQQVGGKVTLKQLQADWSGLQPVLAVQGVQVTAASGEPVLALERARFRLDIISSVLAWRPVWGEVQLAGGVLGVTEDAQGRWLLQGSLASSAAPNPRLHNKILDVLLASRRIALEQTRLAFTFNSGEQISLASPTLLLENSGAFHRLTLQLDTPQNPDALHLMVEGRGDPREAGFTADAYLKLHEYPASQWLQVALGKAGLSPARGAAANLSANIWLTKGADSGVNLVGDLTFADAQLQLPNSGTALMGFRTDISGQIGSHQRWHLSLQNALWQLNQGTQLQLDAAASRAGAQAPVKMQLSSLDLAKLTRLMQSTQALSEFPRLHQLAQSLNARGQVQRLEVAVPPADWRQWQLAANVEQVEVSSWKGVPAFSGVSGYVHADAQGGYVQLDARAGFSMAFAKIYRQPLAFDSARGRIEWHLQPEQNRVFINSGKLEVSDGDERAQGYFHLQLPWQPNSHSIDLTVYVSAQQVAAGQYKKYLPAVIPELLAEYLDQGIGLNNPGYAPQAAFIYRGSIDSKASADHSVALSLEVADGDFNYHPDWPVARHLNGHLTLDNTDLYSQFNRAQIYNSDIHNARVTLTDNPQDEGKVLGVTGQLEGIASDGLRILRQSVLRRYVGDSMDTWYLHGELEASLDLAIPLVSGAAGADYNVQIDLDAPSFALDNYNLELSDFSGRIGYDSKRGLSSEQLRGRLFGSDVSVSLGAEQTAQQHQTLIDVQAQATAQQLAQWSEQPALEFIEGALPLDIHIALNHNTAHAGAPPLPQADASDDVATEPNDALVASVGVHADLKHARVALPAPLAKATGEPGELVVNYVLGQQTALVDVHYLDQLRAMLHIDPKTRQLLTGAVGLRQEPELLAQPGLHVTGHLERLEVAPWQAAWQRYRQLSAATQNGPSALPEASAQMTLDVPVSANIQIDQKRLGSLKLDDIQLKLRQMPQAWDFMVVSDTVTGEFRWPLQADEPWQLNISQLALPAPPPEPEQNDASETRAPSEPLLSTQLLTQLQRAEVNIQQLRVDGEDYGQWQFTLEPSDDALTLQNLQAQVRGLTLAGSESQPASVRWQVSPPYTQLQGQLSADNMAEVMRQWQAPPSLETDAARYQYSLGWPGDPLAFDLTQLVGDVSADIGAGRFIRDSPMAAEGLLKLMGLFNFDSLARRLRLDFSDLYKSGLTFDKITGAVHFDSGQMTIVEPVLLRTPSSRMQLTGDVDLVTQTLDARLVATLPMGGNLTVIAALAAGLPAAAGVFVISKLFEEQMNKATSLTYRITGDWDDPVTAFDRADEAP